MDALVGTSGWTYRSWRDPVYGGVPQRRWLEHYATLLRTVELNASHYRWPRDEVFTGWRERLPAGFEMAVKAPRALTHARRLADRAALLLEGALAEIGTVEQIFTAPRTPHTAAFISGELVY